MTDHDTTRRLNGHIAGSLLFLGLAFAGWGAFLYTLRTSHDLRAEFTNQISRLEADLGQVASERDQWRAAGVRQREFERELTELQTQLQAARSEAEALRRSQEQKQAELDAARQEAASLSEQLNEANGKVSQTGTVSRFKRRRRSR